jgi:diguanylate cyclase (GGDEF)-like protein
VAGSPWRIVLSAPTHALLAPLSATRTVAWQVFSVFAAAILCALGLAAFALRSAHRLAYARLHDELTGLPNRQVFMKRAEQALAQVRLRGGHLATLFIDLDQFKPINDEHGHAAGDVVLAAVAARLKGSVRSGDLVSRFGGDEFLVLCSALVNREQALEIAQRIQGALSQPFQIDGISVTITASIGVAFHSSTDLTIDVDSLVGYADLAMYEAKKQGRAGIEMMDSTAGTPVS